MCVCVFSLIWEKIGLHQKDNLKTFQNNHFLAAFHIWLSFLLIPSRQPNFYPYHSKKLFTNVVTLPVITATSIGNQCLPEPIWHADCTPRLFHTEGNQNDVVEVSWRRCRKVLNLLEVSPVAYLKISFEIIVSLVIFVIKIFLIKVNEEHVFFL